MFKLAFILLLFFTFSTSKAQFLGGSATDLINANKTNITCVTENINPFIGGLNNGASNLLVQNITCTVSNINPFMGGNNSESSNANNGCSCNSGTAPNSPNTCIWIGAYSNDWNLNCNWSTGYVPNSYSTVIIPQGTPILINNSTITCSKILLSGHFINNGIININ